MRKSVLFLLILLLSLVPFSTPAAAATAASPKKSPTPTAVKRTKASRAVRTKTTKRRAARAVVPKATRTAKAAPKDKAAAPKPEAAEPQEEPAAKSTAVAGGAKTVVIKVVKAALRSKAVQGAKTVRLLTQFTPIEVQATEGSYAKVKTADGVSGYVSTSYIANNNYVSTLNSSVKVRSGPGPDDTALFALKEHYPLRVVGKSGDRVEVKDYEGDGGWVHENMLSPKNYVIAKDKSINLREGPGVQYAKRFIADRGALFEVMEEKDGWLRLKYTDGDEGWCSAKIVWGWLGE